MSDIQFEDKSGDKKYFTMLPNIVLNHSTAIDQALYCQLKKHAGENGVCFVSERTLLKKLGIGTVNLKKSFAYLLKRGWIKCIGEKEVFTNGGVQRVKCYTVVDIWDMNNHHYKGASETAPLSKGASSNASKVLLKQHPGASETAPNKNHSNKNLEEDSEAIAPQSEAPLIIKAMEVIDSKNKRYYGNTTQRNACDFLLKEYGLPVVLHVIEKVLPLTNKRPRFEFPHVSTPQQLVDSWVKVKDGIATKKEEQKKLQDTVAFR